MPVTITVPEEATAGFVIAADTVPADVSTTIQQRLPTALAVAVTERLGGPGLTITRHRATSTPWDLSGVTDLDDEHAQNATHHIGVTSTLPVGDLPSGPHLARAAAMVIAESLHGVPVDLTSNEVLPVAPFGRIAEFTLADGWLGTSLPPFRDSGACTTEDGDINGCTCVDLTTRGLHRFGLPELEITGVACPHDLAALNVLRTTAQRLLPLGRHPGEHTLPNELMLTSLDFAMFWGLSDSMWEGGPITIRITEVSPNRLSIRPPADFPGTLNEWLWDELPPDLHELLSCDPDYADPT
ncbi:hypothetical protein GCM10022254_50650 [Actinomadura meridiana]|uniref:Uncharacterized protein n=1 Tax=Actinomadura meridiana TaxID=559626 RepID=A0ABP8CCR8_9ACTN